MLVLQRARSILLLLAASSLAACGATLPRSLTIDPGQATILSLRPRSGPVLTLRNESSGSALEVYSRTDDPGLKVVADAELQALLDVFTADGLFQHSLPQVPASARDVLRLEHAGRTWIWARRGSDLDPREAAFVKGRNYFFALYNGNTAYHSDDGARPSFETEAQRVQREAEAARRSLQQKGQLRTGREDSRGQGKL